MAKVKQKISVCFRSIQYTAAWCRIYSYLKSMAHQGYNPLTAIQIALNGKAVEMIRPRAANYSQNRASSYCQSLKAPSDVVMYLSKSSNRASFSSLPHDATRLLRAWIASSDRFAISA